MPQMYGIGTKEEAIVALHHCKKAWEESEDAITMLEADAAKFTRAYVGRAATANASGSGPTRPGKGVQDMEKPKATGAVLPTLFGSPKPTSTPAERFPPTPLRSDQKIRFVYQNDPAQVLVYVDGACSNNGQLNPRAGWAVVYGPGDAGVVSGRLEEKGPFGEASQATSNRAELRAAIAALRLCDWRSEGFFTIVLATDSTYVIDGATNWVGGWIRNGWKTRTDDDVKNRDLWDLLLGEVEKWKTRGLLVKFWKISRDQNAAADAAAKKASLEGTVEDEFADLVIGPATAATTGIKKEPRVLTLCLEYGEMFDDLYSHLISQIKSKAEVEQATTTEDALRMLDQQPPPSVILVADGGITRQRKVLERVIGLLREGATVILAACFSSFVSQGEFDRLFATIGLPWKRGSYHREVVKLHRDAVGDLADRLSPEYSQKALFAANVDRSAIWYAEKETSTEGAVVCTKVMTGTLGYVGDVNGEEGSKTVIMAMCGLLN